MDLYEPSIVPLVEWNVANYHPTVASLARSHLRVELNRGISVGRSDSPWYDCERVPELVQMYETAKTRYAVAR